MDKALALLDDQNGRIEKKSSFAVFNQQLKIDKLNIAHVLCLLYAKDLLASGKWMKRKDKIHKYAV